MARIDVVEPADVSDPTFIEGFPGVGLVGKIAADHLVEAFEMVHHGNVHCEGLPPVATYGVDDTALRTPVRLYADDARDLLVLQSDVPVAPEAARAVLTEAVEPIAGVEVPTDDLVDRADAIRQARERLARRMQEAESDSSRAQPLGMYQ